MTKIVFLLSVLIIGTLGFSSCKKCYDCSRQITTTVDGVQTTSTDSLEVCGKKDMEQYEVVGYECTTGKEE